MVKTHALIESISANLGGFLNLLTPDLKKPPKKFLRDAIFSLIRAGRPIAPKKISVLKNNVFDYNT